MDDATCCWPKNSKNLRTKIIKQAVPQPDWGSYTICAILGRYVLYGDALEAEKAFAHTTDEESDDNFRPGKRKIKKKIIPDAYSIPLLNEEPDSETFSSSSSEVSTGEITTKLKEIPSLKQVLEDDCSNNNIGGEPFCTKQNLNNLTVVDVLSDTEETHQKKKDYPIDTTATTTTNLAENIEDTDTTLRNEMVLQNFTAIPEGQLKVLTDLIVETHATVKMILQKINMMPNTSERNLNILKDDKIKTVFPLNDMDSLLSLELNLGSDEEMAEQLMNRLSLIGGTDYRNLIRRSLQFLFTDDLGLLCSWTGQKDNFRIKDLKVIGILSNAVKASFNSVTDKEFAMVVGDWFRFSKQRKQRKQ